MRLKCQFYLMKNYSSNISEEERPIEILRFVLYARKSTTDEGSQIRSIDDQIEACKKYAESRNIHIVEIIKDEGSAKRPTKRDRFRAMMKEFGDNKKYDALIAYHPDRIARNMLDAGRVIDMLSPDNGIIKSLVFPTVQFANDSSGRLTLAVLFSLSAQFSEHLSEVVKRGNAGNLDDGKSNGHPKWGYKRNNITNFYEPDDNFPFIKTGWNMREGGSTQEEIVQYWKDNDVHRMTVINRKNKVSKRIYLDSEQKASNIFQDTFYYGLFKEAGREIDLRSTPNTKFTAMIDEKTYWNVRDISQDHSTMGKKIYSNKRETFYPLRQFVICDVCKQPMSVGSPGHNGKQRYLYFRCDTKGCARRPRNIRGRDIFDPMYKMLDTVKFSKEEYEIYNNTIGKHTEAIFKKLKEEKSSLVGTRNHITKKQSEASRQFAKLRDDTPETVRTTLTNDLQYLQTELINIEARIKEIDPQLKDQEKIKLSEKEFLNLINSLSDKMRAGIPVEKDILCRKLFLNITIDNKKALSYLWKEPFNSLIESKKISFGARERT